MRYGIKTVVAICDEHGKAPTEVVLFTDGLLDVVHPLLEGVSMDKESAEKIIADFEQHGVDIPIDYNHATERTQEGVKAPAAGWVKLGGLRYEKGKGLIAAVEWTADAKAEIEAEQYKYLSPVVAIDLKAKRIVHLDSVALTNKPATRNQPELMAAAEHDWQPYESKRSASMKKKKTADYRRPIAWARIKLEEAVPGVDIDVAALPPEEVEALDEVGAAILTLADTMRGTGAELPDDADSLTIISMANDIIGGSSDDEEVASEKGIDRSKAAAELSKALGLPKGSTKTAALEAISKLQISKGAGKSLVDKVAALEAVAEARAKADKEVSVTAALDRHVEAGHLNPHDKQQMSAARTLAESNPEEFEAFVANLEAIPNVDRTDFTTGDGANPKNDRERIILTAGNYWENTPQERMGNSKSAWINASLDDERMKMLTTVECEKMGVG